MSSFRQLFWMMILLEAAVSVTAYHWQSVPVSTEIDSVEYIRTADNVLAGNGFSIEETPPWRPNAFRTPGPLLINVPLRILSFNNELLAIIISRIVLVGAALLVVQLAVQLGLSQFAWLAGTFFIVMPSVSYYSLLPYSTETPYAGACSLLFLATLTYLERGTWKFVLLLGLAASYSLYLRPAALFVLAAYITVAILIAFCIRRHRVRRCLFFAAASCFCGVLIAYGTWSYRNYAVFGSFQYSTVSGFNLLHINAREMNPYLDERGKQELKAALVKYPIFLQRYNGNDQFAVSNHQGKEGLRLILNYPIPFLKSHFHGVTQSFFVFSPRILKDRSPALVIAASLAHSGLALVGVLGLAVFWTAFSKPQSLALSLMIIVGVVSTLTGGALFSPRFRIPLDILFAIGCALFAMRMLQKDSHYFVTDSGKIVSVLSPSELRMLEE